MLFLSFSPVQEIQQLSLAAPPFLTRLCISAGTPPAPVLGARRKNEAILPPSSAVGVFSTKGEGPRAGKFQRGNTLGLSIKS